MSGRLPSGLLVGALLRRVNDAGGIGAVLARGDPQGGAILVVTAERGGPQRLWERGIGPDGATAMIPVGPGESDGAAVADYWRRRRARDPDLWVIDLDIASAERFAAETILGD